MARLIRGLFVISLAQSAFLACGSDHSVTQLPNSSDSIVGGHCTFYPAGITECLEFAIADQSRGKSLCTESASKPNASWLEGSSCDVPAGTQGCKVAAFGTTPGYIHYKAGVDMSSSCNGTVVVKEGDSIGQKPAPIPTVTPTPIPTPTVTPAPIPTPSPNPVPFPTPIPTPVPVPVPAPIPTPIESAPPISAFLGSYEPVCHGKKKMAVTIEADRMATTVATYSSSGCTDNQPYISERTIYRITIGDVVGKNTRNLDLVLESYEYAILLSSYLDVCNSIQGGWKGYSDWVLGVYKNLTGAEGADPAGTAAFDLVYYDALSGELTFGDLTGPDGASHSSLGRATTRDSDITAIRISNAVLDER